MKRWLVCIVSFLLWICCTSQRVCKQPEIDFGDIVKNTKKEYWIGDRVQYTCHPGYDLEGSDWTTCKEEGWTPPPKCLAPCSITKQQLDDRNLLLHGGQRRSELIRHADLMEFVCVKGYVIISPSVRMCVDGNLDLPSCEPSVPGTETFSTDATTSKRLLPLAWNFSNPVICVAPEIEKGNFLPVRSEYNFEEIIRAACNPGYMLQSHSNTFKCTKYGWLPYPKCIPKRCNYPRIENGALSWSNTYYSDVYFPKKMGESIRFKCNYGFLPRNKQNWYKISCTDLGWDPEPECFKNCIPPKVVPHGHAIYDYKNSYIEGDNISFHCDMGYHPDQQTKATCTKNDWSPPVKCSSIADPKREEDFNGKPY
ncbi:complement factor H-related protein 2-like [Elgaria multicarinata webbii]|uniref:complement factor H-related protein 2-like n=1 Tax=Elgaria multicarinata webbii TaxID=159646 RepID=UPI002FCCB9F1